MLAVDTTRLVLVLAYCISCCLAYFDSEDLVLYPGDVVVAIRPRRSNLDTKRSALASSKKRQMISDLIHMMNDAERLRFGRRRR